MKKHRAENETAESAIFGVEKFARGIALSLDMPGIFFVEAKKRVHSACRNMELLTTQLQAHRRRMRSASRKLNLVDSANSWTDIIHGVGSLETCFSKVFRDFAIADVLLVAAAEAYINAIAEHVLPKADLALFDKLSPTGKWLFLPKIMGLTWRPDLSKGHLQGFAEVVSRRNRVVHPNRIRVKSTVDVEEFVLRLRLDAKLARRGVSNVRGLIVSICTSWHGSNGPFWLEDASARSRPPCFFLGSPDASMRLARGRKRQTAGD